MKYDACPPRNVWQKVLGEGFAPAVLGDLGTHLDGCPVCQSAVESLMGGQGTWAAIAAELRKELPPTSPVCQKTMQTLKEKNPTALPGSLMAKSQVDNDSRQGDAAAHLTPPSLTGAGGRAKGEGSVAAVVQRIIANMEKVIIGKRQQITLALVAYLCEGHILLEDVPGVAKTMLARALAKSVGCLFKRIQCTPDLLPTDVTGVSVFNQKTAEFEFRPGPIFAQTVLADEINRATPRTQAALLEAMAERRVTVDGQSYNLRPPFLVIATQNPVDHEGTFPLPEAQLDRFLIRLALGYPSIEEEGKMLQRLQRGHPIDDLGTVVQAASLLACQEAVREIHVDDEVRRYILELVGATRENEEILLGGSPRASLALYRTAQALAAVAGRNFVLPEDVKKMVTPVLGHRIILRPEARIRKITPAMVLSRIVSDVPAPVPPGQVQDDAWK